MTDFFQAEFAGTGNLTAYTPEIGAALAHINSASTFSGPPIDDRPIVSGGNGPPPSARLSYYHRNTAGYWVDQYLSGWPNFNLYTSSSPAGPDYYMESVMRLADDTAGDGFEVAHCLRGIAGSGGEVMYFDSLGGVFNVDYYSGAWHVGFWTDSNQDRAAAVTYVTWDTPLIDLGTIIVPATDLTLRTEIEGHEIRGWVNSTLVYQGTYSGTTYFDGAGKANWQYYFFGLADGEESTAAVSAMRAGDAFLSPPSPPGAFWQDYVKSEEVDA